MGLLHTLWRDALHLEEEVHEDFLDLKERLTKRFEHLLANPGLVRRIFGFLREHDPVFTAPGLAVLTTDADVREALAKDEIFSVTEIYLPKMQRTTGDFVLGQPNGAPYQHDKSLMLGALHPDDLDRIRQFVVETSDALIEQAKPSGRIDAVGGLTRAVPARLVGWYFGTPGPDTPTLNRWMRAIFRDIFLNLGNDEGMMQEADRASAELRQYLDALVAERRAAPSPGDDFVGRLIGAGADADTVRRLVGGTIVGAVDTNSKAIAQALDQLLDRPDVFDAACRAAQTDDPAFDGFVWEALRFNPQNPFLIRHCEADTVIAQGTPREKTIHRGSTVLLGTLSAMFDPGAVDDPDTFRPDRPDPIRLHFGHGLHECFGREISRILIPTVAQRLLRQPGLRRPDGPDGQIRYDGAFPDAWTLEL